MDRLVYQTHKVNTQPEVVISESIYDQMGALEKKRIGGIRSGTTTTANTFLQELHYKYNIRGWLIQVNNVDNIAQINNGKNTLFAYKLNYNTTQQNLTAIKGMFNGSVSEQIYISSLDNKKRGYGYGYDGVNRLILASFKSADLGSASAGNPYDEKISYDKNGNILKLDRNGANVGSVVTSIDKLSYSYEPGSNRLSIVRDASGNLEGFKQGNSSGVDYTYDEFGNLLSDQHKGITSIGYNHLNLPVQISIGNNKIEYIYSSTGQKLQKKVTQGSVVNTTDYLEGFQYVNNVLSFVPTSEGFFDFKTNSYVYQYRDHLGNVRLSYSDKNKDHKIDTNEIIEQLNYYPFGLVHKGYNQKNDPLMKDFSYQYNGKENQEELGLNLYDYGARNYDAALGRWMNVDPLAEEFEEWNPYAYTFNNPINFTDPTGMAPEDIRINGANNSSVTIVTDLLDVTVDASSFVGDLGGNYTLQGNDVLVATLDIVGVIDPTGVADVAAATLEAQNGNYGSALLSGLGVIPYVGDLGKVGKIGKHVKTIEKAIDGAKTADNAKTLLKQGRSGKQERLAELMTDPKLGKSDKGWLKQEKNQIDRGKRTSMRNPPGKDLAHERGREAAKGYSYKHSNLQNRKDHRNQHKYDNNGKRNKERPIQ